jgi:hypothetical protein
VELAVAEIDEVGPRQCLARPRIAHTP